MKTQVTIESEMKRRMDLVNDESFRIKCIGIAKQLGVTAKEWNESKAVFCMLVANQVCRIENEMN